MCCNVDCTGCLLLYKNLNDIYTELKQALCIPFGCPIQFVIKHREWGESSFQTPY